VGIGCLIGFRFPGADINGPVGPILRYLFAGPALAGALSGAADIAEQAICTNGNFGEINYGHAALAGIMAGVIAHGSSVASLAAQGVTDAEHAGDFTIAVAGGVFSGLFDQIPGSACRD
jgi:hypothetical protein